MGCDKTENFKRFSVEYYEMGSGLHRSKMTLTTEMLSTMTTDEMDAKCDERGGGRWYYLDISEDEWRKKFLTYYPDTEIEDLVKMHIYEIATKLMMTDEEEKAASEDNGDWEDMPDDEVKALIEAGAVAIDRYLTYKKNQKKDKKSSAISKEKKTGKKTEPEKKKKEKVDLFARFKNTNRTFLPAKAFQKWLQEEENQDKPTLVKFFNPTRGTFVYKRLTMVGPEGCAEKDKNPKWVVEDQGLEDYMQEDDDYI